eukprot:13454600-Alexandrium_andersonii.AAC.1
MARSSAASASEEEEMKNAYPIMLFDRNIIDVWPFTCFVQPFVLGSDQGVSDGIHGSIFDIYLPPPTSCSTMASTAAAPPGWASWPT